MCLPGKFSDVTHSMSPTQKMVSDYTKHRVRHATLARTPPCCNLDVLHYGRHWGLSRKRLFSLHLYVTARPPTKAAVTALLLTGSSLHGGPHCSPTTNNASTATSVAPDTTPTCQPRTVRMVMWCPWPEEEQATRRHELNGQRCCATATSGLHQLWWVLVHAWSGNRLHSVQPCVVSTGPDWAHPRWHPASPATRTRVCYQEHTFSCRCFMEE